ncbi:MAG: hypothetical protein L0J11_06855, partial [Micrococcaceae bacterium]|nr:hypothetical protein [Micrococcaceae bacterium]
MNDSTPHTNGLRHEIFDAGILPAAGEVEPAPDTRTANWFRAVRTGFHAQPYTTAEAARIAPTYRVDGRRL